MSDSNLQHSSKTSAPQWMSSREVRNALRVSSCKLMHLREAGKLPFKKEKNGFFYEMEDVQRLLDETRGYRVFGPSSS